MSNTSSTEAACIFMQTTVKRTLLRHQEKTVYWTNHRPTIDWTSVSRWTSPSTQVSAGSYSVVDRIWLAATCINLSGSGSWTFPAPDWTNNKHAARWAFIAFYFQTIKKWQLFRKRATAQMFYYKPNMIKRWILFTFRTAAVYLSCFHPHSSLMGFHLSASQAELWRPTLRETADSRSLTGRCGESDWAADVLWPLASPLGAADDTPPSISAGSMSVCVCVCATPSPCDHTTHCLFIRCR